jgi:hypothetical protein
VRHGEGLRNQCIDAGSFSSTRNLSFPAASVLAWTSFRIEETISSLALSLFISFSPFCLRGALLNADGNDAFIGVGSALRASITRLTQRAI